MSNLEVSFYVLLLGWGLPFLGFTLMTYLAKGKSALDWPSAMKKSGRANLSLYLINSVLLATILKDENLLSGSWDRFGLPSINESFWDGVPVWGIIVVTIIVKDFINYWNHRMMHSRFLWNMHGVHHSDPDMNFTTTYRVHVLEPIFMKFTFVVGASWLGLPDVAIVLPFFLTTMHNAYVHVDIDWSHGRFAKWLASPRYHRWHHADHPDAHNKNFANLFPIWDVMFNTYYCPGKCEEPLGFEGAHGHDLIAMMMAPFMPAIDVVVRQFNQSKLPEQKQPAP